MKRAAKYSSRPLAHYIVSHKFYVLHFNSSVAYCISQRYHLDPMEAQWVFIKEGRNHTLARKLTAGIMSDVRAGKTELLQEFEATVNVQRLLNDGGKEWFRHMNLQVTFCHDI